MSNLLSREYIATNPRLAIIKICTFLHLVHFSWVCFAFVVFFLHQILLALHTPGNIFQNTDILYITTPLSLLKKK